MMNWFDWIPAFAGMTDGSFGGMTGGDFAEMTDGGFVGGTEWNKPFREISAIRVMNISRNCSFMCNW